MNIATVSLSTAHSTHLLARMVRNARCCDALAQCADCRRAAAAVQRQRRPAVVAAA